MERLPDQLAGQPLAAAEGREGADDGRGSTSTSTPDGRRLALARRADEAPAPTTTDGRRARLSIPHDERRSHVQFRDDRGDRRGLLGTPADFETRPARQFCRDMAWCSVFRCSAAGKVRDPAERLAEDLLENCAEARVRAEHP